MDRTFVFDLDGTLCTNTEGDYEAARPLPWAIERVNALKRAGHRVVVFTARGTTTGIDWRPTTEGQLRRWGVEYDELILGKPYGDVYVDDKALHVDAWRYGHARELSGPGHAPPRAGGVLEVARTFAGAPFRAEDHARRLLARAAQAGIAAEHTVEEIAAAAADAARPAGEGDDVVIALFLGGAPHAAFLESADGAGDELVVTSRLLSQPAGALRELLRGPGAVAAATDGRAGVWPLRAVPGGWHDPCGGEVAVVRDGTLFLAPHAAGVACDVAEEAGLEVRREAAGADAAEELLVLGLPFCVLSVVELDGEAVGDGDGGAARAIAAAWREATGLDVVAQVAALAGCG